MGQHTIQELQQWQALPLNVKVLMTKRRIRDWVNEYGINGVYVSFSGGKDSTVLLHMVREEYPDVRGVFVDTGLEYPEIREFVKTFDNIEWLKPKMNFRQVIEKYGYPFISKEVSECVQGARKYLKTLIESGTVQTDRQIDVATTITSMISCAESGNTTLQIEMLANLLNERMVNKQGGSNQRLALMLGLLTRSKDHPIQANIPSIDRSMFSQTKYKFFLDAPFEISNRCCNVMKKSPAHEYTRKTGRHPITAQMASESRLRTQKWLQSGCNGFELKEPISNPMAFWTEQDVLLYIKQNNLPICSVYGDIVYDYDETDDLPGQLTISDIEGWGDMELFDSNRPPLKTTGYSRTGCMFCGYGCHLEKPGEGRFERMKETHPKQYDYIMRPCEQGGLNFKEIIDWINKNGGFDIRY